MLTPRNWTSMVVALVTMLGWIAPVVGQCQYQVTIIPEAPCLFGLSMGPHAINRHGHVVGEVNCVGGGNPVAWYGGPNLTLLPIPPGYVSGRAHDINDADEICGYVADTNGLRTACVWRNGQPTLLGIPAGGNYSTAEGINNKGEICGYWGNSNFGNPALRACVWRDGMRVDLVLPIGPESAAHDINDNSQVTGWMGVFVTNCHAFRWTDQFVEDLGVVPGGYTGQGQAISENGSVAGIGYVEAERKQPLGRAAAIWHGMNPVSVPPLPLATRTFLWDVTDYAAVGFCVLGTSTNRAIVVVDGIRHDLSTLTGGIVVPTVAAVNTSGVIAGWVVLNGNRSAILTRIQHSIADVTGNCRVDVQDLLAVIGHWQENDPLTDFNQDQTVNIADLLIVIQEWDM